MKIKYQNTGTGKTTLCKALAQKVFIRNSNRFTSGGLLEINSHALFSKWFSESGNYRIRNIYYNILLTYFLLRTVYCI